MKIYSIRDQIAEFFIQPFVAENDAHAKRMFCVSLGDSFPHRSDFQLYRIGSFDADNGLIQSEDPQLVLAGMSLDDRLDPRHFHNPEGQKS